MMNMTPPLVTSFISLPPERAFAVFRRPGADS
jgi:hypothetical protein